MSFFLSLRLSRTNYVFSLLGLNLAYLVGSYYLSGWTSLTLVIGFHTDWDSLTSGNWPFVLPGLAFDALVLWCMMRRLHDTGWPGWLLLAVFALAVAVGAIGAVIAIVAMVALLFLPGNVGPNRFGPDPRGWESREQFDEQRRRLKSGEV